MKKTTLIIIGLVVFSGVALWFGLQDRTEPVGVQTSKGTAAPSSTDKEKFDPLPSVELRDYSGTEVQLTSFVGKPLIVNSWASWCPFCVNELPDFADVQQEFGDQVQFIAVNRSESLETAKGFSDKLGVTDKMVFLLDKPDKFYRSIGGFSMPETLLVDAKGNIREHKRGPISASELRNKVQELIAQ